MDGEGCSKHSVEGRIIAPSQVKSLLVTSQILHCQALYNCLRGGSLCCIEPKPLREGGSAWLRAAPHFFGQRIRPGVWSCGAKQRVVGAKPTLEQTHRPA